MLPKQLRTSVLAAGLVVTTHGMAANLDLSNTPLYLGGNVAPNIMFILDDSGSMMLEVTPDDLALNDTSTYGGFVFPRADNVYGSDDYADNFIQTTDPRTDQPYAAMTRSSQFNASYYNPAVTYTPWVRFDGSAYPNANPSCAYHNPERTGSCPNDDVNSRARDLTVTNDRYNNNYWRVCTDEGDCNSRWSGFSFYDYDFWPATYYFHTGGDRWNINNYDRVEIRPNQNNYSGHGRSNRSDCNNGSCTYAQEIQNFANWYTYYRSRILSARAGIGKAFALQGTSNRIGYGAINKSNSNVDGENTSTIVRGVREFSGQARENFFEELYGRPIPALGTPLRRALDDAGQYFSRDDAQGPWNDTPGQQGGDEQICRQNYSILMTDGYWSGGSSYDADTNAARQNNDGSSGPVISKPDNGGTYQYTPQGPYRDNASNTLADVAMHYWKNDLRTDLENDVPTSTFNEAFWQHMVTFGVSLGVEGSIDKDAVFSAVESGSDINWPDTDSGSSNCSGTACAARLDDLLHASVNSRGDFFNSQDSQSFAEAIDDILSGVADRTSSAASVALNAGTLSTNSRVYQARFDSGTWTGELLAFNVGDAGALEASPAWDAGDLIPAANSRRIITWDEDDGEPFRWSNLSNSQRARIGNQATLNYIRGDASNELRNNGSFRNRVSRLGDIINSAPTYAGPPAQRYRDNWGNGAAENITPYSVFRANQRNRKPLIYVGANDGMMHAFDAATGAEVFSYVPSAVFDNLNLLTDTNYTHRYFVDGSPVIVDAHIKNQWRTVLVSGVGGGGQGIFALDVTNPGDFNDETNGASQVLWEFTDQDDADLGYTYGEPSIVRLQDGTWAALFSGGYNNTVDNVGDGNNGDSTSGDAVMYLVDLESGDLIKKFDTKTGMAEDPTGENRPNGLATPAAVDTNGDQIVDYIYAGDLFGNMWKIDLSSDKPTQWDFAFKQGNQPQPIYQACASNSCNSNNVQPITTRPVIVNHRTSAGYMVLFGTGKYLESGDNSSVNQTTQSFYGIWDRASNKLETIDRSDLLPQQIIAEGTVNGNEYRVTTQNTMSWTNYSGWYLDLVAPGSANNRGERQVSQAVARNGRIIFTTLIPSTDACDTGGESWIMELSINSGGRLDYSPFDINNDGLFNTQDYYNIGDVDGDGEDDYVPTSGTKSEVGITSTPSFMGDGTGQTEYKYISGADGNIQVITENPGPGFEGRQSWRQLEFLFR